MSEAMDSTTENLMATSLSDAESPRPQILNAQSRLGLATGDRVFVGTIASGFIGAGLGAMQGGQTAQLRFRAEHAHKMPDTTAGWFFYHKSKNYHAMYGGIREGMRMAARTSFWTFLALSLESTVDNCRGSIDMFSTVIASVTVAGAFSLRHRFSISTAARTARQGLLFGLVYGGTQDLLGLARGRPVGYVDFLRRTIGSPSAKSPTAQDQI